MDPRIENFLANAERFGAVVDRVDARSAWSAPSACEGWTGADVVDHVVDTQRGFLEARDLDVGARPEGGPAEVWRAHLAAVRPVVADDDVVAAPYDGYFGPTTLADTLADFYGFDLRVHRWDLARAAGEDETLDEAELDALETALEGFGEALYSPGVCKPALPVADDAPRQARVLARMGRL